jgi:hypothetical protein
MRVEDAQVQATVAKRALILSASHSNWTLPTVGLSIQRISDCVPFSNLFRLENVWGSFFENADVFCGPQGNPNGKVTYWELGPFKPRARVESQLRC